MEWKEIVPALGAEVTSHTAREAAGLAARFLDPAAAEADPHAAAEVQRQLRLLGEAFRARSLLVLHGKEGEEPLHASEIRALYQGLHKAVGLEILQAVGSQQDKYGPPGMRKTPYNGPPITTGSQQDRDHGVSYSVITRDEGQERGKKEENQQPPTAPKVREINRASIPGFKETQALGHKATDGGFMENWRGLTGRLDGTSGPAYGWWQREVPNWHPDGAFSASSPPPPAIVAMYCEEPPKRGGSVIRWEADDAAALPPVELPYVAGATIFFSTKLALKLAPRDLVARARRLNCVYTAGFGKAVAGVFPEMTKDMLVPQKEAPNIGKPSGYVPGAEMFSVRPDDDVKEFRHALVQKDDATGEEYILVHSANVDYMEEEGVGAVPWAESMQLLQKLMAAASRPPHVVSVNWRAGDFAIWDNRSTMHNVTPSLENFMAGERERREEPGFVALGENRIMLRTEMQSSWMPRLAAENLGAQSKL